MIGYHSQISALPCSPFESPAAVATDLALGYGHRTVLAAATLRRSRAAPSPRSIGPNGAGKSTLLTRWPACSRPERGGSRSRPPHDRAGWPTCCRARQVNEHLPLTVRETVTMGRYAHRRAVPAAPRRRPGRGRAGASSAVAIADLASRPLASCPAGSASGPSWPRAWPRRPSCCCSTSRSPGSTSCRASTSSTPSTPRGRRAHRRGRPPTTSATPPGRPPPAPGRSGGGLRPAGDGADRRRTSPRPTAATSSRFGESHPHRSTTTRHH